MYDLVNKSTRQLLQIKPGDTLALSYDTQTLAGASGITAADAKATWVNGVTRTLGEVITIQKADSATGEYLYGFVVVDLQGNNYMTEHIAVTI
ncbi:MAG TPA: hypothetical protein DEB24_03690 [Coriobacteriia bacterium]|nr:hypothetical protein [Coriobacteriia bacterium]